MFTKISVLIPTRRRVERLKALLASFEATTDSDEDVELVFRVDSDDRETLGFLFEQEHHVVIGPRHEGYRSMPVFFNEMAAAAAGDVLMCGNDDMLFKTPYWPSMVLNEANKYPDGIFDLGVMTMNETHYPFSIVSRKAVEALGFIWDPRIFWGDIFLRDVMAWYGRCVMLPDVQVEHDWAGNRPDQVFQETRASKSTIEGSEAYWTAVHWPAVREAVKKLEVLACRVG